VIKERVEKNIDEEENIMNYCEKLQTDNCTIFCKLRVEIIGVFFFFFFF